MPKMPRDRNTVSKTPVGRGRPSYGAQLPKPKKVSMAKPNAKRAKVPRARKM